MEWIALLEDNSLISERDTDWDSIKDNIKKMGWIIHDVIIWLPENVEYSIPMTSASATLQGNITIESRYIPFKLGSNSIKVRIINNNIQIEAE